MACARDANDEIWKGAIRKCLVKMESDLNFDDVSSHLIACGMMTPDQSHRIKNAKSSRRCQTERLLDFLDRKNKDSYDKFLSCLRHHHSFLFDYIQGTDLRLREEPANPNQPPWRTILQRCRLHLVENIDVKDIKTELRQNDVFDSDQEERIMQEPDPCTQAARMRILLDYLLTRDEAHFDKFLNCLGRSNDFVKKMVTDELDELRRGDNDEDKPFWKQAISNKMDKLTFHLDIRDICDPLVAKRILTQDKLEECTTPGKRTRKMKVQEFMDFLMTRTKKDFDAFLVILVEANYSHLRDMLRDAYAEAEAERQRAQDPEPHFPAQETVRPADAVRPRDYGDGLASGRHPTENTVEAVSETLSHLRLGGQDEIDAPDCSIDEIRSKRRSLILPTPEQGTGFSVRFRLPSGEHVNYRFRYNDKVKDMINAIGSHKDASEDLRLKVAGGITIESNTRDKAALSKTLKECKITDNTVIHVMWLSRNEESHVFVTSPMASDHYN